MSWAAVIGGGAALLGGVAASKGAKSAAQSATAANQAQIDAAKMDPRQEAMIYGKSGSGGLLDQYQKLGQQPQMEGLKTYGAANDGYLGYGATQDREHIRDAAYEQMLGRIPSPVTPASQVNAPSQNGLDLKGSYDKFINGNAGANPYLTQALQGGVDQSKQMFDRMQGDSTRNLHDVLGGLRSNSVIAGQYGGSRQGIAEGRALGDFGRAQQTAIENFGNNNTSAIVGAQAGAFDRGQDRALSATQGLGAQQYGVASQNANLEQAANLDNQHAQLQMNQLNATNQQAGIGNLQGVINNAYGVGQNADNYDMNKAAQTNGLLQPYLTKSNNVPAAQPIYSNTAGSALGGAAAGLGLWNQFQQANSPKPTATGNGIMSGFQSDPYGTYMGH